jgi:uncharacterized small protein (DUF1192 family)
MDIDDILPKRADDPLVQLVRQDLDRLSADELDERVAILEAEIERCRARKATATSHRSVAESLFKR